MSDVGRLAFRAEGEHWNVYYALPGSMDGAIPLCSIRLAAVHRNPDLKAAFMALAQELVGDLIEERLGERPAWNDPRPAPEHERSGSA